MVAFDEAILLWVLRGTHLDLNAQAGTEADEGGGKIEAFRTAHPAGIAIQGDEPDF